jgi:hypothetical protein
VQVVEPAAKPDLAAIDFDWSMSVFSVTPHLEDEFDIGRTAEAAIERVIIYSVALGYLALDARTVEPGVPDGVSVGDKPILTGSATAAVGTGLPTVDRAKQVNPGKSGTATGVVKSPRFPGVVGSVISSLTRAG